MTFMSLDTQEEPNEPTTEEELAYLRAEAQRLTQERDDARNGRIWTRSTRDEVKSMEETMRSVMDERDRACGEETRLIREAETHTEQIRKKDEQYLALCRRNLDLKKQLAEVRHLHGLAVLAQGEAVTRLEVAERETESVRRCGNEEVRRLTVERDEAIENAFEIGKLYHESKCERDAMRAFLREIYNDTENLISEAHQERIKRALDGKVE